MFDHHALGQSGGSGRVDDVRQIVRLHNDFRRLLRPLAPRVHEHNGRVFRRVEPHVLLREQDVRRAVAHQVDDAFRRVVGVDRYVCRSGLEHGEERDNQIRGAPQADCYGGLPVSTQRPQVVRECVGSLVELSVRQPAVGCVHGDRVRRVGYQNSALAS